MITILLYRCTNESAVTSEPSIPFVKSHHQNPPVYLQDVTKNDYRFRVEAIAPGLDTIDLATFNVVRQFEIVFSDSLKNGKPKSPDATLSSQRIIHECIAYPAPYAWLDSFSMVLDTTFEVNTELRIFGWKNEDRTVTEVTRAYPLFIRNLSPDTVQVLEYPNIELQILNQRGEWESLFGYALGCANGIASYKVASQEYVLILIPISTGTHQKSLRVKCGNQYSVVFQGNLNL